MPQGLLSYLYMDSHSIFVGTSTTTCSIFQTLLHLSRTTKRNMNWNIILILVFLHARVNDCWKLPKPIGRLIDKLFEKFGDNIIDSNACHDMCTQHFPPHDYIQCYLSCYEELEKERKEEERRLKEEKARRKSEQKKREKKEGVMVLIRRT
ncbi:unnamed protein product [Cylicocyclus nassatus]|uniref:Uncharacterized protein n=1 Tax=Cylicocyclus nassatus TaxID=53992 RepID=A0AA36DL58_CYLNA|nr:unnamed protein product [Cylicocyclus nassatus]